MQFSTTFGNNHFLKPLRRNSVYQLGLYNEAKDETLVISSSRSFKEVEGIPLELSICEIVYYLRNVKHEEELSFPTLLEDPDISHSITRLIRRARPDSFRNIMDIWRLLLLMRSTHDHVESPLSPSNDVEATTSTAGVLSSDSELLS